MGLTPAEPEAVRFVQVAKVADPVPEGAVVPDLGQRILRFIIVIGGGNHATPDHDLANFANRQLFHLRPIIERAITHLDDLQLDARQRSADTGALANPAQRPGLGHYFSGADRGYRQGFGGAIGGMNFTICRNNLFDPLDKFTGNRRSGHQHQP